MTTPTGPNCSATPAHSPHTGLAHRTHEGVKRSGAAAGDVMRLFVAIAPPAAVLDELDAQVGPLRARQEDLRWTNREAWHVTLAFLGQVDEPTVARLMPRLERAARRYHKIRLAFSGAGAFPAADRANVLWSGLSGDCETLARLAESVAAGASRAGTPPPGKTRRFQPHMTLARCRMPADVTEPGRGAGQLPGTAVDGRPCSPGPQPPRGHRTRTQRAATVLLSS